MTLLLATLKKVQKPGDTWSGDGKKNQKELILLL
jgi:hypothetical protein